MALSAGTRLGVYEILSLLGAGGMGEVYRARDTRLRREVALKILPDRFASDPDRLARFEREAQVLASLNHPHIAQIYGVEDSAGVRALVMELVEGPTLSERIAVGPIPPDEAGAIGLQMAGALEAAHERGVIHRDLKPANIKLTPDGTVKILDFGLAKALHSDPPASGGAMNSPTLTARGTAMGVLLGTAAYMAPEQVRGRPADTRADIWAFGLVLFEMLAGSRPFAGAEVSDVLADILRSEPAWEALPAGLPVPMRRLLRRCLEKDPRRRLQHIGDARLELEEAQEEEASPRVARESDRRRSPTRAWSVAGVMTLVAAGALVTGLLGIRSAPSRQQMRFGTVTSFSGVEAQPTLSPDGRSVAFVSNRDGQWDIYVSLVTGGTLVRVTNDPNLEVRPRWSPDGTRILYGRLNDAGFQDLWIAPALGGPARLILTNAYHPAWSPDGGSIAYSAAGVITIADATGASPRAVSHPQSTLHADYQPAFSRDGRLLAFIRRRGAALGGPYGALVVVDVNSGKEHYLTHADALSLSPVWSPDDRFVYFAWSRGGALNVWKIPSAGGEPEQITAGQGDDTDVELSADGTRLVFSTFRLNVNLAEMSLEPGADGRMTWLTTDSARAENRPVYSPDGRRIAYFSNRLGAERESIWLMDADGTNPTKIVEEENRLSIFPRWTADSRELLFMTRASSSTPLATLLETGEIRRISIDGGAPSSLPIKAWSPAWGDVAPDGRIVYRASADRGEIYDPRTGERQPIAGMPGDPLWSRDGRSFAFIVRQPTAGAPEAGVYVETPGQGRRQVFGGWVVGVAWSWSGDLLVLEGKPDLKGVLWRVKPDAARRERLLDAVPLFLTHINVEIPPSRFDLHPDGRRIVIEALESFEADIGLLADVR